MIEITCTAKQKERLIDIIDRSGGCPYMVNGIETECLCYGRRDWSCLQCAGENIKWNIREEG